jgi:hypothetical protein
MPDTIAERVARGAKLLDERRPGWAEKIDLAEFKIKSCSKCALGQVYGDFDRGWDVLSDVLGDEPGDYGFDCIDDETGAYPELQRFWLAEIDKRIRQRQPATA